MSNLDKSYEILEAIQQSRWGKNRCDIQQELAEGGQWLRPCAGCCHCHNEAYIIEEALDKAEGK